MRRSSFHSRVVRPTRTSTPAPDAELTAWLHALTMAPVGMVLLGANGEIRRANHAAHTLLGIADESDEARLRHWAGPGTPLCTPDGRRMSAAEDPIARALASHTALDSVLVGLDQSTGRRWLELSATPLLDDAGALLGLTVSLHDRTEAVEQARDPLTGLLTRAAFLHQLERLLAGGETAALLLLDLDHFKEVNDTLGDRLLVRIADRVGHALTVGQRLARLGGDEFAVLLPGISNPAEATAVARRLRSTMEVPLGIDEHAFTIGASIGLVCAPASGGNSDALLRCADVAMYQAKRRRSGIEAYNVAEDPHTPARLRFLSDLPAAIETGQLFLCYQPKEDLRTGRVVGLEALVRWRHPTAGLIPPDEFIGFAEQRGLIGALTTVVLDEAIGQIAVWERLGLAVPVAVNLSARSLQDQLLPDTISGLCEAAGVPPHRLELEITETTVMSDPAHAHTLLTRLQERGIQIALDDFGTGYSSLAILRTLPVHILKLDRSFVREMQTDTAAVAIVQTVVDLAHNLGRVVVAEGVEDELTRTLLRDMGCDQIQGYYLCKPLPASEITQWLAQRA